MALNLLESSWTSKYVWISQNKQASEYNMISSICYFAALPNMGNQLFIHGKVQVQCTRCNKKKESFKV